MALEDSFAVVVEDWPNLEARLTMVELSALYSLVRNQAAHPLPDDSRSADLAADVFALLQPAIPAEHLAWEVLRSGHTRFAGSPERPRGMGVLMTQIAVLAEAALTGPDAQANAAADQLLDLTIQRLLRFGAVRVEEPTADVPGFQGALVLRRGSRTFLPAFQFVVTPNYYYRSSTGFDDDRPLIPLPVFLNLLDRGDFDPWGVDDPSMTKRRPQQWVGIHPLVRELFEPLAADIDPVGAAAWWLSANAWLSTSPAQLLGTTREDEIGYAAAQLSNDSW